MLWLKTFHLFSLICWFAAIFYLPRLFVYHAMAEDDVSRERFSVMERKLYRGIMTPAAIATVVFGLWMLLPNWEFYKTQSWMHAKLGLVALLLVYHHLCGRYLKRFAEGRNEKTHVYFRVFNEVPVLLLLAILVMVVIKP